MKFIIGLYKKLYQHKVFRFIILPVYHALKAIVLLPKELKLFISTKKEIKKLYTDNTVIFYFGKPEHSNLGDLAQGVCIRKWLKKNYPDYNVIEIETNAVVNTHFSIINFIKRLYSDKDIIIFQSGYTTTDLGGYADEMHCKVMQRIPNAKMLMMPQTVFFQSDKRRNHTSQVYNSTDNLLFLARDSVSYKQALEMFPDIRVMQYPDIVTTLIGTRNYANKRDGILFCCRDDDEKFYSDEDINKLIDRCSNLENVLKTDTTKYSNSKKIVQNAEQVINSEIENYSKYKLIITDRYHGTIFSLISGTPVIIIKTTDHKVITGADWFKGIYDDYVYVADSLEDAYNYAEIILNKNLSYTLEPYFEKEYYDKLPALFAGE